MTTREQADKIVTNHVLWSMGGGLIPVPLFDLAAVTFVQVDMLKQLAHLYGADFDGSQGKAIVSALTASTFAKIGSSMVKAIPGIGLLLGGFSMAALSGASTYAVGQVMINHLENGGQFMDIDVDAVKSAYREALEQGKEFVEGLGSKKEEVSHEPQPDSAAQPSPEEQPAQA
jgi:uncharacterized protein (DUF697 family)